MVPEPFTISLAGGTQDELRASAQGPLTPTSFQVPAGANVGLHLPHENWTAVAATCHAFSQVGIRMLDAGFPGQRPAGRGMDQALRGDVLDIPFARRRSQVPL